MKNIFSANDIQEIVERINMLTPQTQPQWGKMDVAQMLAHCNVTYELIYENIHAKPNAVFRWVLKTFVKSKVVGPDMYPKNGPTGPQFVIKDAKNFDKEKQRLIDYIQRTMKLGESHFEGKESHSFGTLTAKEWNTMMYKHLHHHLSQFGV